MLMFFEGTAISLEELHLLGVGMPGVAPIANVAGKAFCGRSINIPVDAASGMGVPGLAGEGEPIQSGAQGEARASSDIAAGDDLRGDRTARRADAALGHHVKED